MNEFDYVSTVFDPVKNILPTITATQYDYYKDIHFPVAKTIMNRTQKTWEEILTIVGLPKPLDRNTLARLSDSLHFLEKIIKKKLMAGWQERTLQIKGKRLRPDSFFVERMVVNDGRLFIMDVKLCVSSSPLVIYKYLPLFQEEVLALGNEQSTFFGDWLAPEAIEKPFIHYDNEGQTSMAIKNNVLYICYLVGKPKSDVFPGSIISGKYSDKKRKIPDNMEIRYISFFDLPCLYADLANIVYDENEMEPLFCLAQEIKNVLLTLPINAKDQTIQISSAVKKLL